ncbi:type IA DNA topoisomerase [Pantoea ananatis]|uniref:type IA DNA topoisomerase n=1 Tax=Pantoea ananas TaxID=553 RepID=UPI001B3174CB|nr:type IA DNA topoisomerase [Pantoea ananatis]
MRLYIAEKPSVAADIVKALGGQFTRRDGYYESSSAIVSFCVGHVLEMVPPEQINPDWKHWRLDTLPLRLWPVQLRPSESTAKQAATLIELIKRRDVTDIVHCGDPDDEGQLLVDEVLEYAGNTRPVKRALINDNTQPAVKKALNALRDNREFRGLYLKALMRSAGDAIYGYSMTRAYTIKAREKGFKDMLSVGRVQTPVLGLIVRRWHENQSHESAFYYTLTGNFTDGTKTFSAGWQLSEYAPVDEKSRLCEKKWADGLAKALAGKDATVLAAGVDLNKTEAAPLPFSLARLQQYMNQKEKLTAQQTLDITQTLREKHKAITYNRSDCSYLTEEQFADAPALLKSLESVVTDYLDIDANRRSKAFDSKKVTAHTAIIPTLNTPDLKLLSAAEKAVYMAIVMFYVAQFLPKKTFDEASASVKCGDETFSVRARKLTDSGFTSYLGEEKKDSDSDDDESDFDVVSNLRTGGSLTCRDITVNQKKTKPPALFTEATLIAALVRVADFVSDPRIRQLLKDKDRDKKDEHGGIGTPATRAAIIETLKKRNYISVDKGKITPTETGLSLIESLPDIATLPDLTALWSEKQRAIEEGKLDIEKFIDSLYGQITKMIESAEIKIKPSTDSTPGIRLNRLGVKCPSCDSEIVASEKACYCTGCKFSMWTTIAQKKLTLNQIETIIKKGRSAVIKGFKSKAGKTFDASIILEDKTTGETKLEFQQPPVKSK